MKLRTAWFLAPLMGLPIFLVAGTFNLQEIGLPEISREVLETAKFQESPADQGAQQEMPWPLLHTIQLNDPTHYWKSGFPFQLNGEHGYIFATKDPNQRYGYVIGVFFDGDREPGWIPLSLLNKEIREIHGRNFSAEQFGAFGCGAAGFFTGHWGRGAEGMCEAADRIVERVAVDGGTLVSVDHGVAGGIQFTAGEVAYQIQSRAAAWSDGKRDYRFTFAQDIKVTEIEKSGNKAKQVELVPNEYGLIVTWNEAPYTYGGGKKGYKFHWSYYHADNIMARVSCTKYWSQDRASMDKQPAWRKHLQKDFPYAICIDDSGLAKIYSLPAG